MKTPDYPSSSDYTNNINAQNLNIHNKNIKFNPVTVMINSSQPSLKKEKIDIPANTFYCNSNNISFTNAFLSNQINPSYDLNNNNCYFSNNYRGNSMEKIKQPKKAAKAAVEFPSIRTFQKELMQKIYSKESGEILQMLKKSNENIRSSKVSLQDNLDIVTNNNDNLLEGNSYTVNINNNAEKINNNNSIKEPDEKLLKENDYFEAQLQGFSPELIGVKLKNRNKECLETKLVSQSIKNNFLFSEKEITNSSIMNINNNKNSQSEILFKKKIKPDITHRTSLSNSSNFLYNSNNNIALNCENAEAKPIYITQSSRNSKESKNNAKKFPKILKNNIALKDSKNVINKASANLNNSNININSNNPKLLVNGSNKDSFARISAFNISNIKNMHCSNNSSKNLLNNNNLYLNSSINNGNINQVNNSIRESNSNCNINNVNNNNASINIQNNTLYSISNPTGFKLKFNKYFCPHCEHCNVIKDDNFEKYFNMKEARNIVRKSLDFILTNYQTDQSYLDFLLGNNNTILNNYLSLFSSHSGLQQINTNNNLHINTLEYDNIKSIKSRMKFDVDMLLNTYPKQTNNRTVLQLVTHFLDALINDKLSLEHIAGPEIIDKLRDSLISQGISFKEAEGEIEFDKELDLIFDESTKEKLRKLFKSIKIKI